MRGKLKLMSSREISFDKKPCMLLRIAKVSLIYIANCYYIVMHWRNELYILKLIILRRNN